MNTLELKNNILGMLVQINNNDVLSDIYDYVREFSIEKGAETKLTPEQEAELDEAIAEINDPNNRIGHDEAVKMMQLW